MFMARAVMKQFLLVHQAVGTGKNGIDIVDWCGGSSAAKREADFCCGKFEMKRMYSGLTFFAQHSDFAGIASGVIWRFENEGQVLKGRMADDAHECFKANLSFTNAGVAVFMTAALVLTVIEMNGLETAEADDAVKFRQDLIKMLLNVIAAVPDMAGIEADA